MTKEITDLNGKPITHVYGLFKGSNSVIFKCENNEYYEMSHDQECCEEVYLEDFSGIMSPEDAERSYWYCTQVFSFTVESNEDELDKETQWTFYRLNTSRGTMVFRWYGNSHYYSRDVEFRKVPQERIEATLLSMLNNYANYKGKER